MSRVLLFDIEIAGVSAFKCDMNIMTVFGYKWLGEEKAHAMHLTEDELKRFDDKRLLKDMCYLFEEADIIVAHFGSVFDRRFINGRLLIHNLPPIPHVKMRDTCFMARSIGNFSRNSLGNLARVLKLKHQKGESGFPGEWFKIIRGDMTALRRCAKYCAQDVETLEALYLRLRPFDTAHTRLVFDRSKCSVCGFKIQYRGFATVGQSRYRKYVCLNPDCRRWDRERKAIKF